MDRASLGGRERVREDADFPAAARWAADSEAESARELELSLQVRWQRQGEIVGPVRKCEFMGRLMGDFLDRLGSVVTGDVAGVLVGEKGATASVGPLMFALAFAFGGRLLGGAGGGECPRLGLAAAGRRANRRGGRDA